MEIQAGDIILCDAPTTDHEKYHICVLKCGTEGTAACFLFLNSKTGYLGDCVFDNDAFPCLPSSKTDCSIVSFSYIVRYNARQLKLFRAKKVGTVNPLIARKLETFAQTVPTLNAQERRIVLNGLKKIK